MSLSMPTSEKPRSARSRAQAEPTRPAAPVMMAPLRRESLARSAAPASGREDALELAALGVQPADHVFEQLREAPARSPAGRASERAVVGHEPRDVRGVRLGPRPRRELAAAQAG